MVFGLAALAPTLQSAPTTHVLFDGTSLNAWRGYKTEAVPVGGRVVTYNKWPLYTYVADTKPGQATGQALNLNGGLWYVLAPSGKVIRTKLSAYTR